MTRFNGSLTALGIAGAAVLAGLSFGVDVGVASAAGSAPYFSALPAAGSTELQTARLSAVAASLPDGQVLIAGGSNGGAVLQSAELFNPASDTFTALPASGSTELQTPRDFAVAASLPDGQVLIAGGFSGSSYLQTAELFNPASDTFTALPASGSTELQTPRYGAVAASLPDGQVLIAGGSSGGGFLQSAELFNPASDTFTALPASGSTELQIPLFGAAAASLPDGQVLIAGGYSGMRLQSVELFDPASDTFTALPASGSSELQTPRQQAVAASLPDGQVLIAGGFSGSSYLQTAELFDPASDTFTALPASGDTQLQDPREVAVAASLPDGQVLIAGGFNSGIALQSAELFNSAPQAAVAGGDFGDQTVGQPSAVQPLVLTNVGAQALTVSGAAVNAGGDPGEFTITADACAARTLAFEQSCTITARFIPTAAGARSATIGLSDNEPTPSTISLSGTGVAPNIGPVGATGAQGNSGQIELITCRLVTKTVKQHGKKRTVTRHKCTTRLLSGTATFTTTIARATLTRGGTTYATGTAQLTRLILDDRRPLRPGLYSLTLTRQLGRLRFTTREPITIG